MGQAKMGHEKALQRAAAEKVAAEKAKLTGHAHTCQNAQCNKEYRHEDAKCTNIGLAYNGLCTLCSAVAKNEIDGVPKVDVIPDDEAAEIEQLVPGFIDAVNTVNPADGGEVA